MSFYNIVIKMQFQNNKKISSINTNFKNHISSTTELRAGLLSSAGPKDSLGAEVPKAEVVFHHPCCFTSFGTNQSPAFVCFSKNIDWYSADGKPEFSFALQLRSFKASPYLRKV